MRVGQLEHSAADAPDRGDPLDERLRAIMDISHAVATGRAVEDTLNEIARTAASVAEAQASAILLRRRESATGLSVAGSHGLSPEYAFELNELRPIELGKGPSGMAAASRKPVAVEDVLVDPLFLPWRALAVEEHYRAMVSVPLVLGTGRRVIGVLNVYRHEPGPWSAQDVKLLRSLADHAAIAIQTAQLLDESRRQVRGLSLLVRSLRTQSHEHANLIHAVSGLLAIGDAEAAQDLLHGADERFNSAVSAISSGIESAVLSGFLLAETVIAGNGGVELVTDPESRLSRLPAALSELDAITILGNLVRNAVEAVSGPGAKARKVLVRLTDHDGIVEMRVRDWGPGISTEAARRIFRSGYSSKPDHVGLGLGMVRSIVNRARGRIWIEHPPDGGVTFVIRMAIG